MLYRGILCYILLCDTYGNALSTCFRLQETYELKREAHVSEMQSKEEEMRQMFVQRVKEKETELKEAEREVGLGSIIVLYLEYGAYKAI